MEPPVFPTALTLFLLVVSGFDGSNAGDLLDLICVHCSGILYLRSAPSPKFPFPGSDEKQERNFETGNGRSLRPSVLLLFFCILLFRIWYQNEPGFWKELGFLYLCKTGILTALLGFLWFRNGNSKTTTILFVSILFSVFLVRPSQGILNFSYFLLFSFLQADPESKNINAGI
nr:hypothetical protein [Leptospira gomenensis]